MYQGVYYNEIDGYAADWLERLIGAGHLPAGDVDRRDIHDVRPGDLADYHQHHFFAGIGGWPLALRLAGWPDERPVWTGSCPCQPFSVAGRGLGADDPRHLWPVWFRLIAECRPAMVLGEQVASAAGRDWLAGIRLDLEGLAYAVGAADLCAAGVVAPHIRQRLWWVGVAVVPRLEGHARHGDGRGQSGRLDPQPAGPASAAGGDGAWDAYDLVACTDGKSRRIEPGTFPLAHGVPARVGRLRAYGNAIVPPLAAEFVRAVLDVTEDR